MNVLPIEKQWQPVFDVWRIFTTKRAPQLAASSSPKALTNFLGVHRNTLMACGALAKAANRRWLAHCELFPVAAFALWIGRDPAQAIEEYKLAGAVPRPGHRTMAANAP